MKVTSSIAVVKGPGNLAFEPQLLDSAGLGADDMLCETLVSAISPGSEVAAYRGAPPLRAGVTYPRFVGYCNVARVLARGANVTSYVEDDRIVSFASHRTHFVLASGDVLAKVPDGVSSEDASCAYLFHLGYNAVLSGDVRLGSKVLVLGLGVVGLCTVSMAALAGARVVAISEHADARERAGTSGAACFSRADVDRIAEFFGPGGADVVVSTTNAWSDWPTALRFAGVRAKVVVMGFPGRDDPAPAFNPLDSQHFYARQLQIVAGGMSPERPDVRGFLPFNERANLARILAWTANGDLRPQTIVSREFPSSDIVAAYESLRRRESAGTHLLRWAR